VEYDRRLIPILGETLAAHENVHIIQADARGRDYPALCGQYLPFPRLVACGNLPYYITTEVVCALVASGMFARTVVMVQKEAAARLLSRPGDESYCAAAATLDFFARGEILFHVGGCFLPSRRWTPRGGVIPPDQPL
jgi:16S rRNA (adenine1518-N6/adenine1519-N6)-dimethyltransferase